MSQNGEKPAAVSEDIFSTEELLQIDDELQFNTENATEELPVASMDFEAENQIPEETESENQNEDVDEMIEDTEEATADDLEVEGTEIPEDQESEVTETDQPGDGTSARPAKKAVNNPNKLTELPLSKVKHIIKLDPEVNLVNAEAVFLITKATEHFVRSLGKESFNFATQQKKKTITKQHVDSALQMLPIEL